MRFHHIGVLTSTIERDAHGGPIIADPVWGIRSSFQPLGDIQLEMVAANELGSTVNTALKHGVKIHHICFEVDDLDAEMTRFRNTGWLISQHPRPATAFGGRRVAFLMSSYYVLVELLEAAK